MPRPAAIFAAAGPACLTASVLAGIWADRCLGHLPPTDAAAYHERLRGDPAALLPAYVGTWLGVDVAVPEGAVQLLRPNVLVARRYQDVQTGREATLLLVQCADARDMLGHFPPVCYPAHGWVAQGEAPREWRVGDLTVSGTTYRFGNTRLGRATEVSVDDLLILPDGTFCRDMTEVKRAAQNPRKKYFGAAQVQLVADAGVPAAEREELFCRLLAGMRPGIDRMRSGVAQ